MEIRVQFDASFRPLTGREELCMDLPEGITVRGVFDQVLCRHPRLRSYDQSILFAVGESFASWDEVLTRPTRIAFLASPER